VKRSKPHCQKPVAHFTREYRRSHRAFHGSPVKPMTGATAAAAADLIAQAVRDLVDMGLLERFWGTDGQLRYRVTEKWRRASPAERDRLLQS